MNQSARARQNGGGGVSDIGSGLSHYQDRTGKGWGPEGGNQKWPTGGGGGSGGRPNRYSQGFHSTENVTFHQSVSQ